MENPQGVGGESTRISGESPVGKVENLQGVGGESHGGRWESPGDRWRIPRG